MASLDEVFIADAVTHAYNLSPSNFAIDRYAEPVAEGGVTLESQMPPAYRRTRETFLADWPAEATASVLFEESHTDFAVFHPQSITIFHDGLTALEKAERLAAAYPARIKPLASVDLIGMEDPLAELTRQVEAFDPHGVKVYPSYWDDDGGHHAFKMDDPELAFPLWEHVADLGLDVVAVHKASPFGPVPIEPYRVGDVDEAAVSFPDLTFEIVHGGTAFAEETGWQLARFPNVYVNLERTIVEAVLSPRRFVETMQDLLWPGGKDAIEQVLYGSGAPHYHPQLLLETFWSFDFPEMEWNGGTFTITEADKRKILGENLLEAHSLDAEAVRRDADAGDPAGRDGLADPYSTTQFEVASS